MLIEGEKRGALENMVLDEKLLNNCKKGDDLILHLYEWQRPSLTYGYFIKIGELLNLEKLAELGIDAARRPTGGGVIFHIWDVAFYIIVPNDHPFYLANTLDCYNAINSVVKAAVSKLLKESSLELLPEEPTQVGGHFCMAKPTIYDVMLGGRKIAGSAQRKKKNALLHQGTISIQMPDFELLKEIILEDAIVDQMALTTFALGIEKRAMQEALISELKIKG